MTEASFTFGPPAMSVSMPTSLDMHVIYDAELEMLRVAGKDRSLEFALAAGGAGVGLMQNLLKTGHSILWLKATPDPLDFVLAILCAVFITVAIVSYRQSQGIVSKIDKLVGDIRQRPKHGNAAQETVQA